MAKRVLIIGAGVSGLSAGCYARMNGYDVEIHESHDIPGGLCTSWKRGDYLIDGCIHWLQDSKPGSPFYHLWEELGVLRGRTLIDHDVFVSVVGLDGRTLHFYTDTDRLEAHFNELSPQDADATKRLCALIRKISRFSYPAGEAFELMGRWDGLRILATMLPYMGDLSRIGNMTLRDLSERFTDPLLRSAIANFLPAESMPASALFFTLGPMSRRAAGYPVGGSLAFARDLEARLLELGGEVHYRSRVAKVLERNGRATGVRLKTGDEIEADYIVSATDMRRTLFGLLDGGRIDPVHHELMQHGRVYPPLVQVAFGAAMDFSDEVSYTGVRYELERPVEIAGQRLRHFGLKNYSYDPTMAPPGKTVVMSGIMGDWSYWKPLIGDREAYRAEKSLIAELCTEQIEQVRPGFASSVEVTDVATPPTFQRYSGNWHGTYMTWMLDPEFQRRHRYIPKTVPGLAGFYLASMWTDAPGGIPGASAAGRTVVQLMCHEDGKRFETQRA